MHISPHLNSEFFSFQLFFRMFLFIQFIRISDNSKIWIEQIHLKPTKEMNKLQRILLYEATKFKLSLRHKQPPLGP